MTNMQMLDATALGETIPTKRSIWLGDQSKSPGEDHRVPERHDGMASHRILGSIPPVPQPRGKRRWFASRFLWLLLYALGQDRKPELVRVFVEIRHD